MQGIIDTILEEDLLAAEFIIIVVIMGIVTLRLVENWRILERLGEVGWASLVPFYGSYLFYKRAQIKNKFNTYLLCWIVFWIGILGIEYIRLKEILRGVVAILLGEYTSGIMILLYIFVLAVLASIIAIIVEKITRRIYIAKSFGKGKGFGVFYGIFPLIGGFLLAFGKE